MKLHVKHTTDYRYSEPLRYALQTLWLTPQSGPAQTVNFWSVGAPQKLFSQKDAFGNTIESYTFVGQARDNVRWSLVNAAGDVQTWGVAEFTDDDALPHPYFFLRPTHLAEPHWQLAEFGRKFLAQSTDGKADLSKLLALSRGVSDTVSYKKIARMSPQLRWPLLQPVRVFARTRPMSWSPFVAAWGIRPVMSVVIFTQPMNLILQAMRGLMFALTLQPAAGSALMSRTIA